MTGNKVFVEIKKRNNSIDIMPKKLYYKNMLINKIAMRQSKIKVAKREY